MSNLRRVYGHEGERHVFRCVICNVVNNEDIQTDLGDFNPHMAFVPDPKNNQNQICIACREVIDDVLLDYEYIEGYKDA